ncbi:MAG TPA: S8 family serine peptidase, partial [Thermoanaerobaculia bacterium]
MIANDASSRLAAAVLLVSLVATAGLAARPEQSERTARGAARLHRIIEFEHAPLAEDREALERLGVAIVQPISARRAVVSATASALAELSASGLAVVAAPAEPEARLHATAVQELARRGGVARLEVVFHEDVPLADAVAFARAAGAWPVDPLPLRFAPPRNLEVWASADAARAVAALDAVAIVHAPEGEVEAMNAEAAKMSNVDVLYQAPYGLSGQGVVVGVVDIGNAQAAHLEFEARVTAHSGTETADHPTHVVGTIAAKGIQAAAKGMAPAVTVHQYAQSGSFLTDLESNIPALSLVAVNNSWGYITGWNYDDTKARWGWYGRDAFGAYSSTSAGIDQLTRSRNALIVFSAGNDGNDNGPTAAPWQHVHPGDADAEAVWCVSADRSGTDCPATPCANRCEIEKHPADGTWGTISRTASSKNGIGVGALHPGRETASFSARGPTRDGRVKPDLVAKGTGVYSTVPSNSYARLQGTSMSTPVVTGIAALLVEQWRKTIGGDPGAAALKGLLIHGAQDLGLPGPDYR